jgi:addiction module HigA family antidote
MKRAPTHPGEMLLEEFLKPLGMSQADAARKVRVSSNRLNELIRKKRGVTAETALRLADLLGTSPEFWLNLQTTWDLWHAYRVESDPRFLKRVAAARRALRAGKGIRLEELPR